MTPYWKAYFEIRGNIREGLYQAEAIEKFGKAFGYGADYRYLRQIASEQTATAQAA